MNNDILDRFAKDTSLDDIVRMKEEALAEFRGLWCRLNKNIALRRYTADKLANTPIPTDKLHTDLSSLDQIIRELEVSLCLQYNDIAALTTALFLRGNNFTNIPIRVLADSVRAVVDATVVELANRYTHVSIDFYKTQKEGMYAK